MSFLILADQHALVPRQSNGLKNGRSFPLHSGERSGGRDNAKLPTAQIGPGQISLSSRFVERSRLIAISQECASYLMQHEISVDRP